MKTRSLFALTAIALTIAACGMTGATSSAPHQLSAETASFDIAANSAQPFLIGLIGPEQESVAYGTVQLTFTYSGPVNRPLPTPRPGPTATAHFVGVPGQSIDLATPGPKLVEPSIARGVYQTDPITFDAAGYWEATTRITVNGRQMNASAAFEVLDHHQVLAVGDRAPHTIQALGGDPTVPASAIDSRAQDETPIPDPELHNTTIAAALDAHRPIMVVVATPTYCTSRFCGPITDAIARLAARYGDRMTFVHLEIWADFTNHRLNSWVNDWIIPRDGTDGREPWVFVINRDGIITHRFDNLVNDAELDAAAQDVMA